MAPSLVQSASATGSAGTTLTVTLPGNTTAGNCLVVCIGATQSTVPPTVSGVTLGGSAGHFAAAATAYTAGTGDNAAIWVDPNCAGGQTSVVITFTGGSGTSINYAAWVMEWSGISGTSPADQSSGANGNTSSFSSGATGTTAQASELVVGVDANNTLSPTGPSSPWTNLTVLSVTNGVTFKLIAGYQVVSATGTFTYSGSIGAGVPWGAAVATLKAGSSSRASALLLKFP